MVKNDAFAVTKEIEVKTCITASAPVENGSVKVNGVNDSAILLEGNNTIQIIANEGYQIDTFVVAGVDVTAEIVNGYYTYEATTIAENVYYTATFKKLTYTVTFMAGEDVLEAKSGVEFGTLFKDVAAPEIPAKAGYEIQGWSVDGETEIKTDVTVYAVYGLKSYTITFDVDGGTPIDAKSYTAEEVVMAFDEEPVKDGYVFEGWYLDDTKFVFGNVLTGDITLKAKWTAVQVDEPTDSSSSDSTTSSGSSVSSDSNASSAGCGSVISELSCVLGLVVLAAGISLKRKNDRE
jgi:uncharacterized repeat protein (TIGR02543 family)